MTRSARLRRARFRALDDRCSGPTRRRAIPTRNPTKRAPARRATRSRPAKSAGRAKSHPKRPRAEQPLGVGVADAFAVRRLKIPAPSKSRSGVLEIGWAEFGALANTLAAKIEPAYQPDVVLGIANAGVFVGGALAPALRAELVHLHLPGRGVEQEKLPNLSGRRVLVVDDAADSGRTLAKAAALAKKARAAEVRTAVIVLRPGGAKPDFHAIESSDVIVFGWDYQVQGGGTDGDPGDAGV